MIKNEIDLDKVIADFKIPDIPDLPEIDFKIPDDFDLPDIDFDLSALADKNLEISDFDSALPEGWKDLPDFSNAIEKEISSIKSNAKSLKRKRGRPTIITDKWCRETAKALPGLFKNGESISQVVCTLGISKRSFLNACQKSKELMRAKKDGLALSQAWWEDIGRKAMLGEIPGFNTTVWIFTMKNRFGWRNKHAVKADSECKRYITANKVVEKLKKLMGDAVPAYPKH